MNRLNPGMDAGFFRMNGISESAELLLREQGRKNILKYFKKVLALFAQPVNSGRVLGGTAGRRNTRCGGLHFL